jgi:hypothetical protein
LPELSQNRPDGLYGDSIKAIIRNLSAEKATNTVAWFCLLTVLTRIEDEWEEDEWLPNDRSDEIDDKLRQIVQKFLAHTLNASYADSEQDLLQLIQQYLSLYKD